MKKYAILVLGALALGVLSFGATADPIGPNCPGPTSDSENCFGNLYALFFTSGDSAGVDNLDGTHTFDISLSINTAGYSNGPQTGQFLYAAGFKIVTGNSTEIVNATLLDAPDGAGVWTTFVGDVSNGCSSGMAGFVCAGGHDVPVPDGIYQWDWAITIVDGKLTTTGDSVKASFADPLRQHGNTSAAITLQSGCPDVVCNPQQQVPEPATLALLGIGLLGLGFVGTARRRV